MSNINVTRLTSRNYLQFHDDLVLERSKVRAKEDRQQVAFAI